MTQKRITIGAVVFGLAVLLMVVPKVLFHADVGSGAESRSAAEATMRTFAKSQVAAEANRRATAEAPQRATTEAFISLVSIGRLLFVRDDNIYNMDSNGTKQLTTKGGRDPAWSSNGQFIAYALNGDIYNMNADGTNQHRLIHLDQADLSHPAWAPDGRLIVFNARRGAKNELIAANADGTNIRALANDSQYPPLQPTWSPDGLFIGISWGSSIAVIKQDGAIIRKLTQDTYDPTQDFFYWVTDPAWSPDGRSIAFVSNSRTGMEDINTINIDGTNLKKIISLNGCYPCGHPTWSPDGRFIAFDGITVVSADGTKQWDLTSGSYPTWAPK